MIRLTGITLLATIAAMLVATGPADAQRGNRGGLDSQWDNSQEDRQEVPLGSVISSLRKQYGGRHLDAQRAADRYIIAWITSDGRRMTIEVDARTGRVLSAR